MATDSPTIPPTNGTVVKQKLPPGMIIGPDGKPCKICTAFRDIRRAKPKGTKDGGKSSTSSSSTAGIAATMAALANGSYVSKKEEQAVPLDQPPAHCPPDVEVLGRSTWTFLHTTAAYYPEKPTPTQRANMLSLIRALPVLYPCSNCALDFGEDIKVNPPDVSGRVGLSRWFCERHNEVNEKLGKKSFDCSLDKTDERWKDGPSDGSCD